MCNFISVFLPATIAFILVAVPYLVAMIWTLFHFLKKNQRAPTQAERVRFTFGFALIFLFYNLIFQLIGVVVFSIHDQQVWDSFIYSIQQSDFLIIMFGMLFITILPLTILTYWFYGKQAQRMVDQIHFK